MNYSLDHLSSQDFDSIYLCRHSIYIQFRKELLTLPRTARVSKWAKILTLETTIFGLKMMVKSGLDFFYFESLLAPSELLLPSAK